MNQATTSILSLGYWFSAYTLGCLLHPYKTVRELARHTSLYPLIFTPLIFWLFSYVVGMVGLRFGWVILWVLGLQATSRFITLLAFLFWWLSSFLLLWQLVLGYLWVRFKTII